MEENNAPQDAHSDGDLYCHHLWSDVEKHPILGGLYNQTKGWIAEQTCTLCKLYRATKVEI